MPDLATALRDFNPWWKAPLHIDYKEREVYDELRRSLPTRFMLSLTGLRRVGKTTLLLKVVQDTIREGMDPRRIVYFSFDEFRALELRALVEAIGEVTGHPVGQGRMMILLDEIQKVEGWESQLKVLYDRLGPRVKFLVSGSESLFIRRGTREFLAGRLLEFSVRPLGFREYLRFRGIPFEPLGLYESEVARVLTDFARTMGFPELAEVGDRPTIRKYLQESVVEKVLFRDLPGLVRVRDISLLDSLLHILSEEPGQVVQIAGLAAELGISRNTLATYLLYLEKSYLVRKLYNFAAGRRKVERKLKKYYPAIPSVDLPFGGDSASRARTLEWLVVTQLRAEYFWCDPYRNEVDVVIPGKPPIPVEVKSGRIEVQGLLAFMRKFGARDGYVVSTEVEETRIIEGRTVHVIPAHKFLLAPPVPGNREGHPAA